MLGENPTRRMMLAGSTIGGAMLATAAAADVDIGSGGAAIRPFRVAFPQTALDDLRRRELIGDDAFHAVEAEIDILDLTADSRIRPDGSSGPVSA